MLLSIMSLNLLLSLPSEPNEDVLEEVESMWDCCGLHEATHTHIPAIRYHWHSRSVWIQNGNAHTIRDKGSKTSKQIHPFSAN